MEKIPSKNKEVLADFVSFCRKNPELRFWQALRDWSDHNFILTSTTPPYQFIPGLPLDGRPEIHDTYYWEGKNGEV